MKYLYVLILAVMSVCASANEALSLSKRASDMAASGVFPASMVSSSYVEADAAGEPYLLKCTPNANRIILYLHTWSADYRSVKTVFPELANLDRACVMSPNFGGPNNTPQAMGSDDSIARIDIAVREVRYKTGLSRVYVTAASGGTMAALNYIAKHPEKVHAASLWLVISDLSSLYTTTQDQSLKNDMLSVIGKAPDGPDDTAYMARSPRGRLIDNKLLNGPSNLFLNVGVYDTVSPPGQGEAVKSQIDSFGGETAVTLKAWPIAHTFDAASRNEAIKQLILE